MRLLTNNPAKRAGLEGHGLGRRQRAAADGADVENVAYLETKQRRMGHDLAFGA